MHNMTDSSMHLHKSDFFVLANFKHVEWNMAKLTRDRRYLAAQIPDVQPQPVFGWETHFIEVGLAALLRDTGISQQSASKLSLRLPFNGCLAGSPGTGPNPSTGALMLLLCLFCWCDFAFFFLYFFYLVCSESRIIYFQLITSYFCNFCNEFRQLVNGRWVKLAARMINASGFK